MSAWVYSMLPVEIDYIGEGTCDDAIAIKLIEAVGASPGTSYRNPKRGNGKATLDRKIAGLNSGAAYGNSVLVLRDLDDDAPCAPALVKKLLPRRNNNLLLRICVKEAESWLFADAKVYASYLGVSIGQIPRDLDSEKDLKSLIIGWAEAGRVPKLHRHLLEARKRGVEDWASLGEWHTLFASEKWCPVRASESGRSASLARALSRIREHTIQLAGSRQ